MERAKELWHEWIPGWLPIVVALLWIGMQYQRQNDRLDSLERQVIEMQEYMRGHPQKSSFEPSKQRYDENQNAIIPPP